MHVHRDWLLTPERAVVHLPTATAVVADLHLGYATARRRAGEAVPEPDMTDLLRPLAALAARESIRRLVIAGDLFEAGWSEPVAKGFAEWLGARDVEPLAVVLGNHDRKRSQSESIPVQRDGLVLGGWQVVHGDESLPEGGVIHGHYHPWLRWRRASVPCYLVRDDRIVLPAYSDDARGVNVLGQEMWRGYRCCAVVGGEVLDLGVVEAIPR